MEDGGMARVTLARHFRLRPRAVPDTAALLRRDATAMKEPCGS